MGAGAAIKTSWTRIKTVVADYLANDDPLAAGANSGAFLVWSSQPLYPLYVWLVVGSHAWPAFLTWLSTPFFFGVPLLARRTSRGGRVLFVVAGLANTLLATKAFGPATAVAWFLVPCLVIAVGFFRPREWPLAGLLCAGTLAAAALVPRLGAPLLAYSTKENSALWRLNIWSVIVLSIYLGVAGWRAHRQRQG